MTLTQKVLFTVFMLTENVQIVVRCNDYARVYPRHHFQLDNDDSTVHTVLEMSVEALETYSRVTNVLVSTADAIVTAQWRTGCADSYN